MSFNLSRPCAECPFRADKPFYLPTERRREIADALRAGSVFHCHKTVDHDEDTGEGIASADLKNSEFCAGALITLERVGECNQMMRIGERLGLYDASALDYEAPVYEDLDQWAAREQ